VKRRRSYQTASLRTSGAGQVQTRQEFASQERQLVGDMSSDIINIMNIARFLTGLAVVALTIYIATIARRREHGVLEQLRSRRRFLRPVPRNGRCF